MKFLFIIWWYFTHVLHVHADDDWKAVLKLDKRYTIVSKKDWKAKPGYEAVLATTSLTDGHIVVSVFKSSEKTRTIIVNEEVDLNEDCGKSDQKNGDLTSCTDVSLDLAPYYLNKQYIAIGVRWNQHQEFPAGESDDKRISLFQIKNGKIKGVLSTTMNSQTEERGPGEMIDINCTLSIEKTKTKDFFDINKRCGITVSPLLDTEDGKAVKKRIENTLFRWNGFTYVEIESGKSKSVSVIK